MEVTNYPHPADRRGDNFNALSQKRPVYTIWENKKAATCNFSLYSTDIAESFSNVIIKKLPPVGSRFIIIFRTFFPRFPDNATSIRKSLPHSRKNPSIQGVKSLNGIYRKNKPKESFRERCKHNRDEIVAITRHKNSEVTLKPVESVDNVKKK